jgi:hypothetical protein
MDHVNEIYSQNFGRNNMKLKMYPLYKDIKFNSQFATIKKMGLFGNSTPGVANAH